MTLRGCGRELLERGLVGYLELGRLAKTLRNALWTHFEVAASSIHGFAESLRLVRFGVGSTCRQIPSFREASFPRKDKRKGQTPPSFRMTLKRKNGLKTGL